MKRLILVSFVLGLVSAEAAVYKGRAAYITHCKQCHGNGTAIAKQFKSAQWREFLDSKGVGLAKLHLSSRKMDSFIAALHAENKAPYVTPESIKAYFENRNEDLNKAATKKEKKAAKARIFQYQSRHLRDFFVEFSKDSGRVPACNDDNPKQTKEEIALAKKIAEAERIRRERVLKAQKERAAEKAAKAELKAQREAVQKEKETAREKAEALAKAKEIATKERQAKAAKNEPVKKVAVKSTPKKELTKDEKIIELVKNKLTPAELQQLKALLK